MENKNRALQRYEAIPRAILQRGPFELSQLLERIKGDDQKFSAEEVKELLVTVSVGARSLAIKDASRLFQRELRELKRV